MLPYQGLVRVSENLGPCQLSITMQGLGFSPQVVLAEVDARSSLALSPEEWDEWLVLGRWFHLQIEGEELELDEPVFAARLVGKEMRGHRLEVRFERALH